VVIALLHAGSAHIDDGALPSAESVLRTADVAATQAGREDLGRAARLLLARCLFWQGKHDHSWQIVESLGESSAGARFDLVSTVAERCDTAGGGRAWDGASLDAVAPPGLSVVAAEIGVRTALARQNAGLAARRLAAARNECADQDPVREGALIALQVLLQGSLGDAGGITGMTASGLDLIRRRHAPLVAQEIRLAEIEALIEAGASVQAAARYRRLSRNASPKVSGLARSRLEGLAARLQRLEGEGAHDVQAGGGTIDTDAVLKILQHCHEAQSESDAVGGVWLHRRCRKKW
jgi:hypothetical protein